MTRRLCSSTEVLEDEYSSFYKSICKDSEKPLAHIHFSAEGEVGFKSILYIPRTIPSDMFRDDRKNDIKLYVRRVYITENIEDLMPKYLGFIRGVVSAGQFYFILFY